MADIKNIATGASFWRGYHYYEENKVLSVEDIGTGFYKCLVQGTNKEPYVVIFDTLKPKKSTCTCPYCDGHPSRFCKHKVASYFAIYPKEFNNVKEQVIAHEKERHEEMERLQREYDEFKAKKLKEINDYLKKLSEKEVREKLALKLLNDELNHKSRDLELSYAHNYCLDFDDDSIYDEYLDEDHDNYYDDDDSYNY